MCTGKMILIEQSPIWHAVILLHCGLRTVDIHFGEGSGPIVTCKSFSSLYMYRICYVLGTY